MNHFLIAFAGCIAATSLSGTADLTLLGARQDHSRMVSGLQWRRADNVLASISMGGTVAVWNPETQRTLTTFKDPASASIPSIVWSFDGSRLIIGGYDGKVSLWNIETGVCSRTETLSSRSIAKVAVSPDQMRIAMIGPDGLQVFDTKQLISLYCRPVERDTLVSVTWRPDGREIATGGRSGLVRIHDVATGNSVANLGARNGAGCFALSYSPDGKLLAANDHSLIRIWETGSREAYAVLKGHSDEPIVHDFGGHGMMEVSVVRSVDFSPDGQLLVSGGDDRQLVLWDVIRKRMIRQFPLQPGTVTNVAFSANGNYVASGTDEGTIRLWKAVQSKQR